MLGTIIRSCCVAHFRPRRTSRPHHGHQFGDILEGLVGMRDYHSYPAFERSTQQVCGSAISATQTWSR